MNFTSIISNDELYFKILEIIAFSSLFFCVGVSYGKYCLSHIV